MDWDKFGPIIFISVIALLWLAPKFWRVAQMNDDPLQKELASLIIELANADRDDSAVALFSISTLRAFSMRLIGDEKEQRHRLAHALSMARPMIAPMQYQYVRALLR